MPRGEVKIVSSRTGSHGGAIANAVAALQSGGFVNAPRYPEESRQGKKGGAGGQGAIPIIPEVIISGSNPLVPQQSGIATITIYGARPRPAPKRAVPRRRAKPVKKPTPRRRAVPRRFPRIPISVPGALRFGLGRLAGVLSLLPIYLEKLAQIDKAATDNWMNLLYGHDPGDERTDVLFGPGSAAPRPDRSNLTAPRLETIVIATPRPRNQPYARPVGAPSPFRALEPFEFPDPDLGTQTVPRPVPRPSVSARPAPSPVGSPVSAPSLQPLTFSPPVPVPRANPRTAPRPAPPRPRPPAPLPLTPFQPGVLSLPLPQPVPKPNPDKCKCSDSKPQKKRKERVECKTGTYTQLKKGIVYHPQRNIPCQ